MIRFRFASNTCMSYFDITEPEHPNRFVFCLSFPILDSVVFILTDSLFWCVGILSYFVKFFVKSSRNSSLAIQQRRTGNIAKTEKKHAYCLGLNTLTTII